MNRPPTKRSAAEGFLSFRPGTQFVQRGRQIVIHFPTAEDSVDFMLWIKWAAGRLPLPTQPESIIGAVLYDFYRAHRKKVAALVRKVDRMLLPADRIGGAS